MPISILFIKFLKKITQNWYKFSYSPLYKKFFKKERDSFHCQLIKICQNPWNCCTNRSTHTKFRFLQVNCIKATLIILDLPPFCNPAERFIRDFRKQTHAVAPHWKKWNSLCCKNIIPTSCQWTYPNLV